MLRSHLVLEKIGVASIEYHFASHYDDDHIGCMDDMAAAGITVAAACYDRGGTKQNNPDEFNAYVAACGAKRQTVSEGQVTTLDQASAIPVTITVVALAGAGIDTEPDQENALSLVLVLSYGSFDEVLGGDLTGSGPDIESAVAAQVGDVEVYKVHHHGSKHSSSDAWLSETTPEVAIISVGGNAYGHPTAEALERMHTRGIKTYWTNPGSGATPDPEMDYVGGTIIVRALPAPGGEFTVSGDGFTDTYVSQ